MSNKARRFGELVRQPTGWTLGWLVVSGAYRQDSAGRPAKSAPVRKDGKISVAKFAELADVSERTVLYYFQAWELAADAGQVPAAKDIENSEDWNDLLTDYGMDEFDNADDIEQHWSNWYQQAKQGIKTKAQQAKSKPEPKSEPKPEPKPEPKTKSDNIIEEEPYISKPRFSERRNGLLDILERARSIVNEVSQIEEAEIMEDGEEELLKEIELEANRLLIFVSARRAETK